MTWTVNNSTDAEVTISGDTRGLTFSPNPVPTLETATATEVVEADAVQELTQSVTVSTNVSGAPANDELTATVTVPACTGPAAPEDISFAFRNEASVETAEAGDTVEYTYCVENTSEGDLELTQLVDDRFGEIQLPDDPTIIPPGDTVCVTGDSEPVTYDVATSDEGTTVANNAVATIQTSGGEPEAFQATDGAEVEVVAAAAPVRPRVRRWSAAPPKLMSRRVPLGPARRRLRCRRPIPETGASGLPRQLLVAVLAVSSGLAADRCSGVDASVG